MQPERKWSVLTLTWNAPVTSLLFLHRLVSASGKKEITGRTADRAKPMTTVPQINTANFLLLDVHRDGGANLPTNETSWRSSTTSVMCVMMMMLSSRCSLFNSSFTQGRLHDNITNHLNHCWIFEQWTFLCFFSRGNELESQLAHQVKPHQQYRFLLATSDTCNPH